jgi:hypothetical protein
MEHTKLQSEDFKEQASNVSPFHSPEATGMRRDNESIDDFEHLEPESSPVKEFQGQGSLNEMDKLSSQEPGIFTDIGHVTSAVSQNTSDFSDLPPSKLDSAVDDKSTPQSGGGKISSSFVTLIDSAPPLLGGHDRVEFSELPEKVTFSQQPQDLVGLSAEVSVKPEIDSVISTGEKLASKFESEFDIGKLNSQKTQSQAFMDTEREDIITEGPGSHKDIPSKFTADVDFLKSEMKLTDVLELDVGKHPSENYPTDIRTSSLSHGDFRGSDALLNPSKSDIKLKEKHSDEIGSSKLSLSAQEEQDDIPSQEEESEVKPTPIVAEPTAKLIPCVSEPSKPVAVITEPNLNPEIVAAAEPTIKPLPDKLSIKSTSPVCPLKTKPEVDDSDLEEIKPIQLFQSMGLGKYMMHLFQS